jgi:hypothetical protein
MSTTPTADYALVSDRHSAGLSSCDGSVDWLCFPRFDSPSVFARLLGEEAGHWWIRPSIPYRVSRRYAPRTVVLETTFQTATGVLMLTDALLLGPDNAGHRLGVAIPRVLARRLSGIEGQVPAEIEYRPRADWRWTRGDIRTTMLREGWDEHAGAFTRYFGSPDLDASTLMMAIVGFLPADDPLARPCPRPGRPNRPGPYGLRTRRGIRQRPGPAGRGSRPLQRRAARQLPSGIQPHRPGQRRLGYAERLG